MSNVLNTMFVLVLVGILPAFCLGQKTNHRSVELDGVVSFSGPYCKVGESNKFIPVGDLAVALRACVGQRLYVVGKPENTMARYQRNLKKKVYQLRIVELADGEAGGHFDDIKTYDMHLYDGEPWIFPLGDFDCTPDGSCPMPDPFPIKVVGPLSKAINAMHFSIALFSVDARPFTGPNCWTDGDTYDIFEIVRIRDSLQK